MPSLGGAFREQLLAVVTEFARYLRDPGSPRYFLATMGRPLPGLRTSHEPTAAAVVNVFLEGARQP